MFILRKAGFMLHLRPHHNHYIISVEVSSIKIPTQANSSFVTVDSGKTTNLSCVVERALPAATLLWYTDNKTPNDLNDDIQIPAYQFVFQENIDKTFITTSKLTYIGKAEDNGINIYCRANNGSVVSNKQLLNVKCKF